MCFRTQHPHAWIVREKVVRFDANVVRHQCFYRLPAGQATTVSDAVAHGLLSMTGKEMYSIPAIHRFRYLCESVALHQFPAGR